MAQCDHYKWRALRANGIPEELITGMGMQKKIPAWQTIPHTWEILYHWTHLELKDALILIFPFPKLPKKFEQANKLAESNFFQGLINRFQVKHFAQRMTRQKNLLFQLNSWKPFGCNVFPTFRPDNAQGLIMQISSLNGS